MASNNRNSPRQKMINLMYLVFIAMLALNVSSEVLDGFDLVEDGLQQTIKATQEQNQLVFERIEELYNANKEKAANGYNAASHFADQTNTLYNHIDSLKLEIVKESDGKDGNVDNIKHKDDLNAASAVMLSPTDNKAQKLKKLIDQYREEAITLASSQTKKTTIKENLSTNVSKKARDNKNWEQSLFEQMPTSAAVTLLTKIQSDIRSTEGQVLSDLLNNIDAKDYRVNDLHARVVPNSMIVMQGQSFAGQIVLSAVDTTKRPDIFIGNTRLDSKDGHFSVAAGSPGANKKLEGYMSWGKPGEEPQKYPFSTLYTVVPPIATIEATKMNVLYNGIENELSISVPGVPNDRIRASVTNGNGSLTQKGDVWMAKPSKVGQDFVISVSVSGVSAPIVKKFRVRKLPDPTPYIEYVDAKGSPFRFKGGKIDKSIIVNTTGVKAAIDDGLLDIQFKVLKFRTIFIDGMGNSIPEVSNGANFSDRQKEQIRKLSRGKFFFVSNLTALGPDGVEREISPMQVTIK